MKVFSNKQSLLPFYWRTVVKPNIWPALMISLLMLAGAILEMVPIGLIMPLLNSLIKPGAVSQDKVFSSMGEVLKFLGLSQSVNMLLFTLLVVVCVVFMVRGALSLLQVHWMSAIALELRRKISCSLFEKSLRARYEDQSKKGRGTILNDINGPADATASAINSLGIFFAGMLNALVLLGFMVYLSWWASIIIGVLAIGGVQALRRILDRRSYVSGRVLYELERDLTRVEIDSIDGLKVVKAHVLESPIIRRQQSIVVAQLRPRLRLALIQRIPTLVNEVGASFIVLGFGAATFLYPSVGMDFPTLVAFLMALRRINPAIGAINNASSKLNEIRRSIEVIEEVLHLTPQEEWGQRVISRVEEIKFANVSFYYASRPKQWALKGVDLTMRRGSMTALVGSTGAGKSTIANLVVGLYTPISGTILVNNVALQELDLAAWRRKIGFVSQDTFLFNATLRENIALWDETVSQAEIEWASRVAQLHDFVSSLPEGYDTVVGDRGLRLSGGQCQRVTIARAIVRRPEVIIFDEATNALDNLTETAVYGAIDTLRESAAVIVIAHRLSTIRGANQIVVLRSGSMIETGTHDSLMKARGSYAKLYEGEGSESGAGLV